MLHRAFVLICVLVLCVLFVGCGPKPSSTLPPPRPAQGSASPPAGEREIINRLLGTWRHTVEWVGVPPLSSLSWRVLKQRQSLPADSLVITDKKTALTLRYPVAQFKAGFVEMVRSGRVLGYRLVEGYVLVSVLPESLYPVRPNPDMNIPQASVNPSVIVLQGTAIYSADHEAISRNYGAIRPHNPPYPDKKSLSPPQPVLPPQRIHIKKGLGIRGNDVASLSPDAIRDLHFESNDGVYVDAVIPGSPAEKAQIQPHDCIRHVNDIEIRNKEDLVKALDDAPADRPITIEVLRWIIDARELKAFSCRVTLGDVSGDAHTIGLPAPKNAP